MLDPIIGGSLAAGGLAGSMLGRYKGNKAALGAVNRQIDEQAGLNRQMEEIEGRSAGKTLGSLSQMQAQPNNTSLLAYMPSGAGVDSSALADVQQMASTDRTGGEKARALGNAALLSNIEADQRVAGSQLGSLGDMSAVKAAGYGQETADAAKAGQWLRLAGDLGVAGGKMALSGGLPSFGSAAPASVAPATVPTAAPAASTLGGDAGTPLANWQANQRRKALSLTSPSPLSLR